MDKRQIMKLAGDGMSADAREGGVWGAVGRRLALRRTELGLSVDRVADGVGIAADDYRDYERGAPIPALRLGEIADLLDRSVPWFFEAIANQRASDSEEDRDVEPVVYKVATVEHRIQALTESFRKLDFEGQQHLLAISRALSRACE